MLGPSPLHGFLSGRLVRRLPWRPRARVVCDCLMRPSRDLLPRRTALLLGDPHRVRRGRPGPLPAGRYDHQRPRRIPAPGPAPHRGRSSAASRGGPARRDRGQRFRSLRAEQYSRRLSGLTDAAWRSGALMPVRRPTKSLGANASRASTRNQVAVGREYRWFMTGGYRSGRREHRIVGTHRHHDLKRPRRRSQRATFRMFVDHASVRSSCSTTSGSSST